MSLEQKQKNDILLEKFRPEQKIILESRMYQDDPSEVKFFGHVDFKIYGKFFNQQFFSSIFTKEELSHFKTLNLPTTASIKEVKDQYRILALQYHPDKVTKMDKEDEKDFENRKAAAQEKFKAISVATSALIDKLSNGTQK